MNGNRAVRDANACSGAIAPRLGYYRVRYDMYLPNALAPLAAILEDPVQPAHASDEHATRVPSLVLQHKNR